MSLDQLPQMSSEAEPHGVEPMPNLFQSLVALWRYADAGAAVAANDVTDQESEARWAPMKAALDNVEAVRARIEALRPQITELGAAADEAGEHLFREYARYKAKRDLA